MGAMLGADLCRSGKAKEMQGRRSDKLFVQSHPRTLVLSLSKDGRGTKPWFDRLTTRSHHRT